MTKLRFLRTALAIVVLFSLNSCGIIGTQLRNVDRLLRQPILSENDGSEPRGLSEPADPKTEAESS